MRVGEVAQTLRQPGKSTETKVREVMGAQAARLIDTGHRDVIVQGLREVEQAMAREGHAVQLLPQGDSASLTDAQVTEAFEKVATGYLTGKADGREHSGMPTQEAVRDSSLAPLMDAMTRVVGEAMQDGAEAGHSERKRGRSRADASFGSTPGAPSPEGEPTQAQRHKERASLDAGIPGEGPAKRDWMSRLFKLNPTTGLHELARKGATLIDLVFDINYDDPRFDNRKHLKELHFTDDPNPTQANLYTNDYGRWNPPGKGPASIHTAPDSPHRLITTLHEMAHHLAAILGRAAENEVANAHKGTRRFKTIVDDLSPHMAEELNQPHEIFARAFAQLIVEEIGKMKNANDLPLDPELQREFQIMTKDSNEKYKTWRPNDFAGVREVLLEQLTAAGWTLRSK